MSSFISLPPNDSLSRTMTKQKKMDQKYDYSTARCSQFAGVNPSPINHSPSISQVFEYMRTDDRLKTDIERARTLLQQDILNNKRDAKGKLKTPLYTQVKTKLPSVTWSGVFSRRNNSKLIQASGLLSFDIDMDKTQAVINYDEEVRKSTALFDRLRDDPFAFCLFPGVSGIYGKGLVKIPIVPSDAEYKPYFRAFQAYFKDEYDIMLDSLPDVSRLCFLVYAPDMFVNESSLVFDRKTSQTPQTPHKETIIVKHSLTNGKLDPSAAAAVLVLKEHGIPQKISRNEFVGLCAVCKEEGINYDDFDLIMQKTEGYDVVDNLKIWSSVKGGNGNRAKMSLASFVKFAQNVNYEAWKDCFASLTGYNGNGNKREEPPHPADSYEMSGVTSQDAPPEKKKQEIKGGYADRIAAKLRGYKFRLNEMTDEVEVDGERLSRKSFSPIYCELINSGFRGEELFHHVMTREALKHPYHPVKQYLEGLTWDGESHVAKLRLFLRDKHDVFSLYLRKWMIGSILKVYTGGQNPMLVLVGAQGIGKGFFAKWLCPLQGLSLESGIQPDSNDHRLRLISTWMWEVPELDATTLRVNVEALKSFLTLEEVIARRPYARFDIVKPALASFIGSTNDSGVGFLRDVTGNRRFRPIYLTDIDRSYPDKVDVDQLWAEAMHYYLQGETITLTQEEEGKLKNDILPEHHVVDGLSELIRYYFDKGGENDFMMSKDILKILYDVGYRGKNTKADSMDLATSMTMLRYDRHKQGNARGYRGIRCQNQRINEKRMCS